jgi:O-glycosyl hydrolase
MKKIIFLSFFSLLFLFGTACLAQNRKTDEKNISQINIDPSQSYQTIEGWGSSLCWWAAQVGVWDEAKVDSIVDLITSPDKLNMNIFRYNIGGGDDPSHVGGHMVKGKGKRAEMQGFKASEHDPYDWNADKGQRTIMLKIKAKRPDVVFEAFSNSPPFWMTYSGCSGGSIDPMQDNLKPEYYEAFCNYLIDFCKHFKDQYGIEFKTLEPFNESTSGYWNYQGSQEGCHFTPETQMKIIRMLYPKLKASGLKTVLSVSDETNIASTIKVLKAYLSAGDILEKVGQLNTHTYSGTNIERTEAFDLVKATEKPFWQSETGPSVNKKSSFETNLFLTQKLFDDMRLMKPQAWLDWQLMEESNEVWCLMRCNFNTQKFIIVKNLYVRMQITRFFKQGYTFIETGNEETLAALNPEKTELVVAVINKSDHDKAFDMNFKAFEKKVKKAVIYRTCSVEDCAKILSFGIRKQAITYSAPGLSLTTFIIPLGN